MYYLNARYYDSKIARFLSEDTYGGDAGDPLSLNLYSYCYNNPIMYTDPTGHYLYFDGSDGKVHESDVIVDENHPYVDYGVPNSGIFVYDDTDYINASNSAGVGVYGDSTVGTISTSTDSSTSIYNYGTIGNITTGNGSNVNINNSGDINLIRTGISSDTLINNYGGINIINLGEGSYADNSLSTINNAGSGSINTIVLTRKSTNDITNYGNIWLIYTYKDTTLNIKDNGSIRIINNKQGGIVNYNGVSIKDIYKGTNNSDKTPCKNISEFKQRYGALLEKYAIKFGIDVNVLGAIVYTESGGGGFYSNGKLKIRFENHVFIRNSKFGVGDEYKKYFDYTDEVNKRSKGHRYRTAENEIG